MRKMFTEDALAAAAKQMRTRAGRSRAQAARDMRVSQTSIFHAEESPQEGLMKLRIRMIQKYSPYKVVGPVYLLQRK